jgi:hypothetical protein
VNNCLYTYPYWSRRIAAMKFIMHVVDSPTTSNSSPGLAQCTHASSFPAGRQSAERRAQSDLRECRDLIMPSYI